MNERIKELALQAGLQNTLGCFWQSSDDAIERFAELVRQDEREANAKLCDDWLVGRDDICEVAKAIRARGNHEPT
jgi:hypothetical protein